jgi:CHAT domain-containing protein
VSDAAVRATVNIGGLSEIIRQEQDAKNEIASLNSYIISQSTEGAQKRNLQVIDQMRLRLNELQLSRNKFKTRIEKEYPDYFQLIQPKSPSIKELAATLKEDELFILILPLESTSYLFAIDKVGNVQFHKTNKGEADYVQIVQRIRKTLDLAEFKTAKPPNFEFSDSYGLYQTIFSSLESFLTGKRHLIVSSSGALSNLPFSVLTRQPFSGGSYDGAPWLINKLAISYVPSASAWIALNSFSMTQSASQPLIAWADPIFSFQTAGVTSGSVQSSTRPISITRSTLQIGIDQSLEQSFLAYNKLPPLPETRDEVIQISKSLNDSNLDDLFLGKTATRESVLKASISGRLAKKKVVIFATHGLQPLDFPGLNEPALAMAITDDPNQSPLLTLRDVMGLKMNADWTVLSACNTAGADGKAGEALSGLARGFFFAGSRSLLVTHWSVESESAMLLTTKTFDSYNRDQNIRRAESLRLAMLDLMKNPRFAHPAYWAPFVLVGDGGR